MNSNLENNTHLQLASPPCRRISALERDTLTQLKKIEKQGVGGGGWGEYIKMEGPRAPPLGHWSPGRWAAGDMAILHLPEAVEKNVVPSW